jgi:adenylate cyclase
MEAPRHTFLFADLVGFTALAEAEGDSRAAEVALALQRRIRRLLSRYRGEEVKALGDALMLRCEGPETAIRLGLRIVAETEANPGSPPVRVGIHTGSAVAHEGDWYGRAVNVASRLCAVAAGGEVLVSEATRSAAGRLPSVGFGEQRLHWLKNVTEPVAAYAVAERSCLSVKWERFRGLPRRSVGRLQEASG